MKQHVYPMLSYRDAALAIDWLTEAFAFQLTMRIPEDGDQVGHAQMSAGLGEIMLASGPPGYQPAKELRESYPPAKAWSERPWVVDGVLIYVEDVRAHLEQARAAGATILSEFELGPPGDRYRAEDCEGHRWMFMQAS